MKLSVIFLSNALFACNILAAPDYLARRQAAHLGPSRPFNFVSTRGVDVADFMHISDTAYNTAWAGAINLSPPAGQTFNGVSTQYAIPPISAPTTGDGFWATTSSIGIDGGTYTTAVLLSGVLFELEVQNGVSTTALTAWYQWYPSDPVFLADTFSFGDTISISIVTTSPSAGTVTFKDITTGEQNAYPVAAPSSDTTLAGQSTEWIVESLIDDSGNTIPLPDFGMFTFSDCVATTSSSTGNVAGAQLLDLQLSDGTILTQSSLPDDSTVQVVFLNSD